MAIKNWVVKTKSVTGGSGGLAAYGRYLEDENHRNHRGKTEAITPVAGKVLRLVNDQEHRATQRLDVMREKGKGGRPITALGQSFVVSLPCELRPTPKQWKAIARAAIAAIQKKLPADQALSGPGDFFVNAHENTKNPHLNIIIGKVSQNGEIRHVVTQKAVLAAVKRAVNMAVMQELGIDHIQYVPQRSGLRNMERWQYEQEKASVAIQRAREAQSQASENVRELAEEAVRLRHQIDQTRSIAEALDNAPAIRAALAAADRLPPPSDMEREIMAENEYEAWRDSPPLAPVPTPRRRDPDNDSGPSGP